ADVDRGQGHAEDTEKADRQGERLAAEPARQQRKHRRGGQFEHRGGAQGPAALGQRSNGHRRSDGQRRSRVSQPGQAIRSGAPAGTASRNTGPRSSAPASRPTAPPTTAHARFTSPPTLITRRSSIITPSAHATWV